MTWLWIRAYDGTQADVARLLKTHSSRVSAWYSQAVRRLPDLEALLDVVERSLPEAAPVTPWKASRTVHTHLAMEEEVGVKS